MSGHAPFEKLLSEARRGAGLRTRRGEWAERRGGAPRDKKAGPGGFMRVVGLEFEWLGDRKGSESLFFVVEWRAGEWSTWRAAEPEEARERCDSAGRAEDSRVRTGSAGEGSPATKGKSQLPFFSVIGVLCKCLWEAPVGKVKPCKCCRVSELFGYFFCVLFVESFCVLFV